MHRAWLKDIAIPTAVAQFVRYFPVRGRRRFKRPYLGQCHSPTLTLAHVKVEGFFAPVRGMTGNVVAYFTQQSLPDLLKSKLRDASRKIGAVLLLGMLHVVV